MCCQFIVFIVFLSIPSPNPNWLFRQNKSNSLPEVDLCSVLQRCGGGQEVPPEIWGHKLFKRRNLTTFKVQFTDFPLTLEIQEHLLKKKRTRKPTQHIKYILSEVPYHCVNGDLN